MMGSRGECWRCAKGQNEQAEGGGDVRTNKRKIAHAFLHQRSHAATLHAARPLPVVIKGKLLKKSYDNDQIHQKLYPLVGTLPVESSFIEITFSKRLSVFKVRCLMNQHRSANFNLLLNQNTVIRCNNISK